METVVDISELRKIRGTLPGVFGLVPTMGALHEGHLALVRRACRECAHVGVSIFVNPAQFGPSEDLNSYPRDLERDLSRLAPLGVDLVWTPEPAAVYPPDFQTWITVEDVTRPLEGSRRPGHFRGVATVVAKLFNVFTPAKAYFGQKDAQQVAVIRRMVTDLNFPIDIVVCPTVREPDGLALSSRNAYLSAADRQAAPVLFRALSAARACYAAGERDGAALRASMSAVLAAEPRARVDYVSAADPESLCELDGAADRVLVSLAVRVGKTRLIDNLLLCSEDDHAARD
jgi:pantoate--beta-alanine ligase